jgi:hypothetical protein
MTVLMEVEAVSLEELTLILNHLRKQGFPARVLSWEPMVIAIDLQDLDQESTPGFPPG